MNTLTIGKLHKVVVHKTYIDGYKDPEKTIIFSEHVDVIITEPFLVLKIEKFKTGIDSLYKKTIMETWIKILIPHKNIVCWIEEIKLTMWISDGNASMVKI